MTVCDNVLAVVAVALAMAGCAAPPAEDAMKDAVPGMPYYFATWTGYEPPVKPHNPIDYAQAESSQAFSVFVFDDHGRVTSFEKWLATVTTQARTQVSTEGLPPGRHFFAPPVDASGSLNRRLSLDDTKVRAEYYRVRIDPDGSVASVERVLRERTIRHDYKYWDGGELQEFRYEPSSGDAGAEYYDRSGKRVVVGEAAGR